MPAAPAAPPPAAAPAAAPAAKPAAPNGKPATSKPDAPPIPDANTPRFQAEYDELDALDDARPKAKEKPETKPEDELEEARPEVKPPEGVETSAKKKPGPTAELKKVYEELKQKVASEYEPKMAKYAELEAKVAEFEKNGGETQKQYQERVAAAEKRAAELEQEIEFVNFSRSRKFVEDYQKPYQEAWTKAVGDFSQLSARIQTGVDAVGDPVYTTRKAGAEDLLALANMPLSEMDEAAERMFGKSAARVIRHVEKVRELSERQQEALANAAKNGSERQKQREQQQRDFEAQRGTKWTENVKAIATKYPKLFAPVEGDAEHNTMLQKGYERADRLFSPTEANKPKTIDEAIQLHALIRAESAAFRPTARKLKLANARIAELEAELKQFRDSEPPAGHAGAKTRTTSMNWLEQAEADIDALNTR